MPLPDKTVLANFIQLPQEPSSGAARSMRTICELLALGGWRVQVLGTTATEGDVRLDAQDWLRSCGIEPEIDAGPQSSRVFRFRDREVDYVLLDVGTVDAAEAEQRAGDAFDQLFEQHFAAVQPDIFLTYGGWLPELERRRRAREAGSRVVFAIHNEAYVCPPAFANIDAAFSPSHFLAERCRSALGVEVTVLPLPISGDEVIAGPREPTFVTFINPELIKGVVAFARIAEEISSRHPEIPFLVVKSRSGANVLVATALAGGFDLRRHSNIAVAGPIPEPRRIYAVTRVLLVPSLVDNAPRVVAEALLNGIPVIASDCGGLPETLRGGGFVLPLPPGVTSDTIVPPPANALQTWVNLTIRLMTDQVFYQEATHRAYKAGRAYDQHALVSVYYNFFEEILRPSRS
jgi:glycosyltransferase involved in cell wall biosynthesis